MKRFLLNPIHDCLAALEKAMLGPRPGLAMILMVAGLVMTWFVYVPIHELLHAFGCWVTGGEVTELQIDAKYGANLLKPMFPFVTVGGAYAGRLTGFNTYGNDLIYLATDFAPFVLSIFPGVTMLAICRRRSRPVLLGASVVMGLAPFYNITGDYYEMGSILSTRVATWISGGEEGKIAYEFVRSDDIFRLFGELYSGRTEFGLTGPLRLGVTVLLFVLSFGLSIFLAFLTYAAGRMVAAMVAGPLPTGLAAMRR
jgi:hypothetical protein